MKKYRVIDITGSFGIFIDDEIEAESEFEAREEAFNEIYDNLGNYINIELEEIDEEDEV